MEADLSVEPEATVVPEPVEGPATPKAKRTKRPAEPDRGPFFTEVWQGRPLYRCPVCRIAKTDRGEVTGDAAIRGHLTKHHATAQATPEQRARAAGLVITKR
jgi:hypothetical protein